MRVNVDSKALADPRFARLGQRLRMTRYEALGRAIAVWMHAYEKRSSLMEEMDVDALAERNGFAKAMIDVDLAQRKGKGKTRLRGVDERIEFLHLQDAKRAKANAARRKQMAGDIPGDLPGGHPYSPDAAPPASQEAPQEPPPEKRNRISGNIAAGPGATPWPADGFTPPAGGQAQKELEELEERGVNTDAVLEKIGRFMVRKGVRSGNWDATVARALRKQRLEDADAEQEVAAPARHGPPQLHGTTVVEFNKDCFEVYNCVPGTPMPARYFFRCVDAEGNFLPDETALRRKVFQEELARLEEKRLRDVGKNLDAFDALDALDAKAAR